MSRLKFSFFCILILVSRIKKQILVSRVAYRNIIKKTWVYVVRHIKKRSSTYYNQKNFRGQKKIKKWFQHIKSILLNYKKINWVKISDRKKKAVVKCLYLFGFILSFFITLLLRFYYVLVHLYYKSVLVVKKTCHLSIFSFLFPWSKLHFLPTLFQTGFHTSFKKALHKLTVPLSKATLMRGNSLTGAQHSAIKKFWLISRFSIFMVWKMAFIFLTRQSQLARFWAELLSRLFRMSNDWSRTVLSSDRRATTFTLISFRSLACSGHG